MIQDNPTEYTTKIEIEAAWRNLKNVYQAYTKLNSKIPSDLIGLAEDLQDQDTITDTIAVHANISTKN